MNKTRLQKLAGITEAVESPSNSWSQFSKAGHALTQVLKHVHVKSGAPEERGAEALNFEQINDIQFTIQHLQEQLDRLDRVYSWRDYMKKKKERMS